MPDQQAHWESWHEGHTHASHADHADDARARFLAALGARDRAEQRRVLEIGCGQGRDAIALARQGLQVVGIDHSSVAIERATGATRDHGEHLPIAWEIADYRTRIREYPKASFHGIYAHLSLHYFSDVMTRQVIADIRDVLTPGGVMLFTVRAVEDPLHRRGDELDNNRFLLDGHVRHFFDEPYTRGLLSGWHLLEVTQYDTSGRTANPGVFIRACARRPFANSGERP